MPTSQTALLVGGTDEHLDRAKALGLTVVLIQHPDHLNPHQTRHADALLMLDYTDWETVWPLAEAAHKVWGFAAVLSLTEGGLETAAKLNEHFGFQANSYEVVRRIRDKAWMRRELAAHGGRLSTDFGLATDRGSLVEFGARAGYPFIVKPTDTAASFGLLKVEDAADIDRVWQRIEQLLGTRTDRGLKLFVIREFLMEAYVDGPEFSVEACSFAGRHAIVTVTEKLQDQTNFVELGHALPARLDPETYDEVVAATAEFLDVMGVTDGPTHTEFRLGSQGPVVIESHTRNGGGGLTDLVIGAYGIDLVAYGVGWPLGLVEELPDRPKPTGAACTRFVLPEPGTVTAITGVDELKRRPDVLDVNVSVAPGDTIRPLRDNWDRVAYLAVRADDTDSAVALCEHLVAEAIRIDVRTESE
ncbi:Biotin carboxylase [Actinokineospora alba]|uniref:Biotin carboxylase n=1 Tax=Actinokineospora alba TaxID=504798 RepID=A0A1H0JX42_9PSEU|nr:ATP-grasp domain-containing protein [Actinokineospora alba]TDP68124.1 biotin carboxylase [Actinokineospora alba]SDH92771.1 Biotin carboxylase [Actinokineospora alba]SDO48358.1 Biotin carboxylase [Actinokineospora alba]